MAADLASTQQLIVRAAYWSATVDGAATQQIIVWAADQSAMEFVEGAAALQIIGQPLEGAAAQQDTI